MSPADWATKDFYEVLGVAKDASEADIKKAYRKLARAHHPDSNPGDVKSEERFKSISEAYSVLSDRERRREYDEQRTLFANGAFRAPGGQGAGGADFSDLFGGGSGGGGGGGFSDLFGGMFGGGSRVRTSPRRGQDVETEADLTFDQALEGHTLSLRLSSEEACSACSGTGAKAGTVPRVCPTCQGSGMQTTSRSGGFAMTEPCRDCLGRGLKVDDPCPVCHGSGRGVSTRTISARIPPGVRNDQRIRLRGKGAPGERGGPNGDLYVSVHVRPHPLFGRKDDNVTVTVPVRFDELALGASIAVPTTDGTTVTLKIPAGTPNGRTFRVKGKGATRRDGTKADLLVTVDVELPKTLGDAERAAVEAYREAMSGHDPRATLVDRAKRGGHSHAG
ncbi:MAG: molecular chaperone DnaJ [Nocardioidaceae bacterium]